MKPIVLKSILIFAAMYFFCSCHKDHNPDDGDSNGHDSITDYLPLKVGARYLYSYSSSSGSSDRNYYEIGECQWEFIDRNPIQPYVYSVRPLNVYRVCQTFNGIGVSTVYHYSSVEIDTTVISNRIDSLTFRENDNKRVTITFPYAYKGIGSQTVDRYLVSSKTDTCFNYFPMNGICLSKNIGIKSISYWVGGNNGKSASYRWIKGPY